MVTGGCSLRAVTCVRRFERAFTLSYIDAFDVRSCSVKWGKHLTGRRNSLPSTAVYADGRAVFSIKRAKRTLGSDTTAHYKP